jgi:putative two-component system response regulator
MRALIADNDPAARNLLQTTLAAAGYEVETAPNGQLALEMLRSSGARLLIANADLAEMNGVELCAAIRRQDLAGYIYIIMIAPVDDPRVKIAALHAGADSFIARPVNPEELRICLKNAERILSLETRDAAMFALAKLAESRDPQTGSHIERVQSYSRLLAQYLAGTDKYRGIIDDEYIRLIHQTSPLHDIGKLAIPDPVLLKPGQLDSQETAVMRTHAELGEKTLYAALLRFPGAGFLQVARDIAATHHEKYDGSGYPQGLAGDDIPLCGRIVALADAYDAMTSRRVYKNPIAHDRAKQIIIRESGSHFDPDVVHAFLQCDGEFIGVNQRMMDEAPGEVNSGTAISSNPKATNIPAEPAAAGSDAIIVAESNVTELDQFRLSSPGTNQNRPDRNVA